MPSRAPLNERHHLPRTAAGMALCLAATFAVAGAGIVPAIASEQTAAPSPMVAPPSDDYTDVQRLVRARRYGDALVRAEQHLQQKPRDAQMRFLLSVIQAETGDRAKAMATLESLIGDFPELAEPYNNLAVLQAAAGDIDAARASLEAAVRADPAYAVAHENLGDILLALAARSYARAAELAPLPSSQARLKMSREWIAALQTAPANPPEPEPAPRLKVLPSSMYNNNPVFINVPLRR